MYFSQYDPNQATLLGVTTGKFSDQDCQKICDDITRLTAESHQAHKDLIIFIIAQPDTERPNATQRRMLGDLRKTSNAPYAAHSVLVTPSLLLRGIITALHWIIPARGNEKTVAFNTFGEAHVWLVNERKKPLPHLIDMYQTTMQQMNSKISA
jgi:hypothetical protein